LACQSRGRYVFRNPLRVLVTRNVPSDSAEILIRCAGVCAAAPPAGVLATTLTSTEIDVYLPVRIVHNSLHLFDAGSAGEDAADVSAVR
jgi:hypothetical protein